MAQQTVRTGLTGSDLVRLLAGWADPQHRVRETRSSFADGLSQWTSWTDAIALSTALDRPMAEPAQAGGAAATADGLQAECAQLRAVLGQAIARDVAATGRSPLDAGLGFSPWRQCCVSRQQAMELAIGALRERARAALAQGSAEQARLAGVDAVMGQVLCAQERRLLATVPTLLEKHYLRLREAPPAAAAQDVSEAFRQDVLAVLLAELDVRLQPVEGLISALRQHHIGMG